MDAEEDTHPPPRVTFSYTHVATGKVSSDYTAALAENNNKKDLRIFSLPLIKKGDRFPFPVV
jgi:hypothetical protein